MSKKPEKPSVSKESKVNWGEIFTDRHTEAWYERFAQGQESARSVESAFRHSESAGPFRKLIRSRGVDEARTLVKKALTRRKTARSTV